MRTDMASTLTSALSGLQVGVNNARAAAASVAKLTVDSKGVQEAVGPLLQLQEAEQQAATTSKVIKAEDETLGRFVDEKA